MAYRASGSKLVFMDLVGDEHKVQIMAPANNYEGDFEILLNHIKRGDIIGVEGVPGRSKTGELSIRPKKVTQLSYCLHMLPK
jgi:lysyl-tRNA synthetase, class II